MKTFIWSSLLLYLKCNVSQGSLYGGSCGLSLPRVFAERLVNRFSHKLEGGFKACAGRCVKLLLCETFSEVDGSCRLFEKDGTVLRGEFDGKCKTNEDCSYKHGHCLRGFCSCSIGFSFDFETNLCVKECASYGPRFSIYKKHSIRGCNMRSVGRKVTIEECTQACRDEISFVCINAEFSLSHSCNLCDKTWYNILPSRREKIRGWSVIYRHC